MKIRYIIGLVLGALLTWHSRMDIRLASYFVYGCYYLISDTIHTYNSSIRSNEISMRRKYRIMKEREYGYGYLI